MIGANTVRWPDRLFAITALRLALWVAIAAISHEGVLSDPFKVADWMDDHQFHAWETTDRETLLRWHQLPAWNPWWCGGTVAAAAPEDPFFGPDFLLRLVFGVTHGRRLAVLLLVVLGLEGMYRLCRRLDSSAVGAAFAAVVFATCDKLASFLHDGWVNFFGFELIPFVLYFLVDGVYAPRERAFRARLLGGFFVAWIILSAGTYPTPYAMLAVGYVTVALTVYQLFRRRDGVPSERVGWRRVLDAPWLLPFLSAATIGLVALGLAAGKMLPTLAFLRQFPRVFTPAETHAATEVFGGFWNRYASVLVLALVGVVTADAAAGIFLGGALLFFALQMGDHGQGSLFHTLRSLPIFGQLRFPDRFVVMVLLFGAVAASRGITRVEDAIPAAVKRGWEIVFAWKHRDGKTAPPPYPPVAGWVFVALAALLAYSKVVRPELDALLPLVKIRPGTMYVQEAPRSYDGPFRQSRGNRRDAHIFASANLGSIYCVAGNPLPESALLRGDLAQEEYPEDPGKATVKRLAWSPNAIRLEVDAKEATTILVNQNWAPGWRASVGKVRDKDKLLAVDVPAGKHDLELSYADRFLELCLLVSLGTLLFVGFYLGRALYRGAKAVADGWSALPAWPEPPA